VQPRTRTVAPAISTSRSNPADAAGKAAPGVSASIKIGANAGASSPPTGAGNARAPVRARRRQSWICWGRQPWR
jgi:hypothetical protein